MKILSILPIILVAGGQKGSEDVIEMPRSVGKELGRIARRVTTDIAARKKVVPYDLEQTEKVLSCKYAVGRYLASPAMLAIVICDRSYLGWAQVRIKDLASREPKDWAVEWMKFSKQLDALHKNK